MKNLLRKIADREEKEMPFLEHLEELRRVLLTVAGSVFVCAIGAWFVSGWVIDYIVVSHVGQAQFLRPMEAFVARMKISLLFGFMVSLPFVAFQIWNFVVPGLLNHERKIVMPLVFFSTLLFLVGTAFSYMVLTPMMIKLLVGFGTEHIRPNITVDYLLDFIIKMAVACGILFQLPLVVAVLTLVRIVTPKFLISKWRHAVVVILIIAAVATPGDGPSQIILAAPIIVLYFLSIGISVLIVRDRKDSLESGESEESEESEEPEEPELAQELETSEGSGGPETSPKKGPGDPVVDQEPGDDPKKRD